MTDTKLPRDMGMHPNGTRPDNGWPGPMPLTRTLPVIDRTEEPLRHMGEWLRRDPRASGFDGVLMAFTVEEFAAFSNRLGGRP